MQQHSYPSHSMQRVRPGDGVRRGLTLIAPALEAADEDADAAEETMPDAEAGVYWGILQRLWMVEAVGMLYIDGFEDNEHEQDCSDVNERPASRPIDAGLSNLANLRATL
jgi:hypothetical protein